MHPILVDFGVWQLRSYGVFVALAVVIAVWWSARQAGRRGIPRGLVYEFAQTVILALWRLLQTPWHRDARLGA